MPATTEARRADPLGRLPHKRALLILEPSLPSLRLVVPSLAAGRPAWVWGLPFVVSGGQTLARALAGAGRSCS